MSFSTKQPPEDFAVLNADMRVMGEKLQLTPSLNLDGTQPEKEAYYQEHMPELIALLFRTHMAIVLLRIQRSPVTVIVTETVRLLDELTKTHDLISSWIQKDGHKGTDPTMDGGPIVPVGMPSSPYARIPVPTMTGV